MDTPGYHHETSFDAADHDHPAAKIVPQILQMLGDKWTILVIRSLSNGPLRFNALRREIPAVSQKMLTSTLRGLERSGLVDRAVTPTSPPQVEYSLTSLAEGLTGSLCQVAHWAIVHAPEIEAAQKRHAK